MRISIAFFIINLRSLTAFSEFLSMCFDYVDHILDMRSHAHYSQMVLSFKHYHLLWNLLLLVPSKSLFVFGIGSLFHLLDALHALSSFILLLLDQEFLRFCQEVVLTFRVLVEGWS